MLFNELVKVFPIMIAVAAGCNKNAVPVISKSMSLPDNAEKVIAAQNQFAFRLFKEALEEDNTSSNKLISPLSIYLDLSMVYNGASGSTRTDMQKALQLPDSSLDLLNQTNQTLITGLPKEDRDVALHIANSIWYRNTGTQPLAEFLKTNSDYYHAQVTGADFSPSTVGKVNQWVASQTNQKIKTILKQIDRADFMYLINAVYFKGQWKNSFSTENTRNRPFHTPDGGAVQTPFMNREGLFNYMQNDSLQLVELPYGNGNFNMYVALPSAKINTGAFISSLNESRLKQYISALDSVKVNLYLPKWTYSYEINDLKPELTTL